MTTPFIINHVWQSSCFAVLAGLLAFVLRKNSPRIRYWVWLSASLKFLIPFALLVSLGSVVPRPARHPVSVAAPVFPTTLVQIAEPFWPTLKATVPAHAPLHWVPVTIGVVWALGFFAIALARCRSWLGVRAALRASTPIELPIPVRTLITPSAEEPGIVGFLRPVLVLPAQLLEHLNPPQLGAILTHELCHVRRRDNFFAAVHMVVEATFWFDPLVWWIGSRMIQERELACDEEVLRMGCEPADYVEGILKVCRFYTESRLPCVSGVTGADVKKRLRGILSGSISNELNGARKMTLATIGLAAFVVPVLIGVLSAPAIRAQDAPAATPKFDVVSIKPLDPHQVTHNQQDSPYMPGGEFSMRNTTVKWLLVQAYAVPMNRCDLQALPDWATTTHYSVDAKPAEGFPNLPPAKNVQQIKLMLQAMLADRFKVTVHHETRETPAFEMTLAKDALKNVTSGDASQPPDGDFNAGNDSVRLVGKNVTMSVFGDWIGKLLGRPVIDETGLRGVYNFDVRRADPGLGGTQPADGGCDIGCSSLIVGALSDQLGLKLHATRAPADFLVLDHIEKPGPN